MRAYRVNLVGSNNHYIITERQKATIEQMLGGGRSGNSAITIGEDVIRLSAIKSLTVANVDLPSCPEYFQKTVERERNGVTTPSKPFYQTLPTGWIIAKLDGTLLATDDCSLARMAQVAKQMLSKGDPQKDLSLRFVFGRAHYQTGKDGVKEYYSSLNQLPDACVCRPERDSDTNLFSFVITQRYRYGNRVF